jgi:hypothetical protein
MMRAVRVELVDPRDAMWEDDEPVFRVLIWSRAPCAAAVVEEHQGWSCREFDVHDADVDEVLALAREESRPERRFSLWVRAVRDGEHGLIRLIGWDPT